MPATAQRVAREADHRVDADDVGRVGGEVAAQGRSKLLNVQSKTLRLDPEPAQLAPRGSRSPSGGNSISVGARVRKYGKTSATLGDASGTTARLPRRMASSGHCATRGGVPRHPHARVGVVLPAFDAWNNPSR